MKTKVKTSLTLSREVVRGIDRVAGEKRSRSVVVDQVLRGHLSHRKRAAANARDAERINRFAHKLNAEMLDVLAHQSLEEFSRRYRIPLGTLRDWEQGRAIPDQPTQAYLTVIARSPEGVQRALGS